MIGIEKWERIISRSGNTNDDDKKRGINPCLVVKLSNLYSTLADKEQNIIKAFRQILKINSGHQTPPLHPSIDSVL